MTDRENKINALLSGDEFLLRSITGKLGPLNFFDVDGINPEIYTHRQTGEVYTKKQIPLWSVAIIESEYPIATREQDVIL